MKTISEKTENPRIVVDFELLRSFAAQNFRDLGGHPVANRRRVRAGMIFRSSHLAEVPPESPISRLELRTVVTLQSRMEVKHMGAPVPASRSGVRWEHIPMGDAWFNDEGYTRVAAEPGREHLAFVTHFRSDWQRFFRLLAERDVYPLLFHCSAGRDPHWSRRGDAPVDTRRRARSNRRRLSRKQRRLCQDAARSRAARAGIRANRPERRHRRLHARGD